MNASNIEITPGELAQAISDFVYKHTSMLPKMVCVVDQPHALGSAMAPNTLLWLNFQRDIDGTPVVINLNQAVNVQTRLRP